MRLRRPGGLPRQCRRLRLRPAVDHRQV